MPLTSTSLLKEQSPQCPLIGEAEDISRHPLKAMCCVWDKGYYLMWSSFKGINKMWMLGFVNCFT